MTLSEYEIQYVPTFKYKTQISNADTAYWCDDGIHVLTTKIKANVPSCTHNHIYIWDEFRIINRFIPANENDRQGDASRYSLLLNDAIYENKSWAEIIDLANLYCLNVSSRKDYFRRLFYLYLKHEEIPVLIYANTIGFTVDQGWQLPGKYYFASGNSFRADIEQNIRKVCEMPVPDATRIKKLVKRMYEITTINNKDYIFAYGFVAPFLYALRSINKLLPLLALGGPGGKGKTAIEEFFTCKMWGNIPEIIGSALMETEPRVQGTLTSSTFPVCIDDCQDLKDFITGILKRYTTTSEKVKKLNPDQSKKMDCEYCSPVMMTFNVLPIMFKDIQFRQRIILLDIDSVVSSEEWLEVYNSIQIGEIGRYIISITETLTFPELVELYKSQNAMNGADNRQRAIAKLMNLGKFFAKQWFDIDLDISGLPEIIGKTLIAGNEEIRELIVDQIERSRSKFVFNRDGIEVNGDPKCWVTTKVKEVTQFDKFKEKKRGYFYSAENVTDLIRRISSISTNTPMNLKILHQLLSLEWKSIRYDTFHQDSGLTKRGIFIPLDEIDGSAEEIRHHLCEEEEQQKALELSQQKDKALEKEIEKEIEEPEITDEELNKLIERNFPNNDEKEEEPSLDEIENILKLNS